MLQNILRRVIGEPLESKDIVHEKVGIVPAIALLSNDSMSSNAYAPEEIIIALYAGGPALLSLAGPVAVMIVVLTVILTVSYQQGIKAFPRGAGVYNIAKATIGETAAKIGAASIEIDYILTVAVSSLAGVSAITSAIPSLYPYNLYLAVGMIMFLMVISLKGLRENAKLLMMPTFTFIGSYVLLITCGLYQWWVGTLAVKTVSVTSASGGAEIALTIATVVVFARAFSSGCSALTGIETVSNSLGIFKEPVVKNASRTMFIMGGVLSFMLVGITLLAYKMGITPIHDETIVSQVARGVFGGGLLYYITQISTMLTLALAANAAFIGFPIILSQLAVDGYAPRQFANLGSRLVFANGIITIAVCSTFLCWFFGGSLHALIPLYCVDVFLVFSIGQYGLIKHWRRQPVVEWEKVAINVVGCIATSFVLCVVFLSKFTHGAWVLLPITAGAVAIMTAIKKHYVQAAEMLTIKDIHEMDTLPYKTMVVLVGRTMDRATLKAVRHAISLKPNDLRALHVSYDQAEADQVKADWEKYFSQIRLDVITSPHRQTIHPIVEHLKVVQDEYDNDELIVVISEIVPEKPWHHLLHNQIAKRLAYHIEQDESLHAEILTVHFKLGSKF